MRQSSLEVALTREVFFRVFETGEALYANAVLVANDVGAMVKDITAILKKEDGATKEFILRVAQIGEKFRGVEGRYQFSFHSSSPLAFIPENNPLRQVYICEHTSYAEATKQEFQKFQQALFVLKGRFPAIPPTDGAAVAAFLSEVKEATTIACTNIMDKIQIEAGQYSLWLTVTYRQKGRVLPISITKKTKSGVRFVVEDYAREFMRHSVSQYLERKTFQFLTDQTETLALPEYAPSGIVELSAQ